MIGGRRRICGDLVAFGKYLEHDVLPELLIFGELFLLVAFVLLDEVANFGLELLLLFSLFPI